MCAIRVRVVWVRFPAARLNNMIILAIETSCDETGISFINAEQARNGWKVEVKANELLSQIKTHAQYGGVFPMLANSLPENRFRPRSPARF